jgi:uncharacterized protein
LGINDQLELIILPTEQCNFRCKYCYEDFKLTKIKREVVEGIKNLLTIRGPELVRLRIQWFGGEPLLCFDIIEELMEFVDRDMPHPTDFTLDSIMTTNGYLLDPAKLATLTNLGVKTFQISFDGDEDEHDKLRVSAAGGSTFAKIWNNLVQASKTDLDFSVMIRVHLNQNNYSSVSKFLERIASDLGADPRFTVFLRGLSRLGGPNDSSLPVLDDKELEYSVSKLVDKAHSLGLSAVTIDSYFGEADLAVCYASRFNSFVIRSDGRIGKCTVALYDEKNFVGRLRANGKIELDKEKILWWGRGNFSKDPLELTCPYVASLKSKSQQLSLTVPQTTRSG